MASLLKSVVGDKHKVVTRHPNPSEEETLTTIQNLVTTPFTIENHESLLKELWKLLCDLLPNDHCGFSVDDFEHVSDAWTSFGFQRADPVSDIRGGGVLCIKQLIYFLKQHKEVAQGMLARQRKHEHSRKSIETIGISKCYPFAAAGINVTRVVAQAFGLVGPAGNKTDFTLQLKSTWGLVDEYDEIYCIVFRLMDSVWVEMDADYMQFSAVLEEVKKRFTKSLTNGSITSYDVETKLFNNKLLYCKIITKGWMEKTPQTSSVFGITSPRSFGSWTKRFFILMKTSPVRYMIQYYKTELEGTNNVLNQQLDSSFDILEHSLESTNGGVIHSSSSSSSSNHKSVGGSTPKGRFILLPTAQVRRIGHNLFILDSEPFKLQLRTSHRAETDTWINHLKEAIADIQGSRQNEKNTRAESLPSTEAAAEEVPPPPYSPPAPIAEGVEEDEPPPPPYSPSLKAPASPPPPPPLVIAVEEAVQPDQ